ncbi:FLYWCH zinc finger domain [Popillia japonica]|uniref:FLYWCH zinc finger domain n=1 Tax=Popillia japonica TaxID=7064 RepID=A0AAW1KPX5_POPJA
MELIETTKGKPSLTHEGYQSRKYRENNKCIITWICIYEKKENCKGRLKSKSNEVLSVCEHTCKPNVAAIEIKTQMCKVKKRAREEDTTIAKIYSEEMETVPNKGYEFVSDVTLYQNAKISLY